jgi:hypothetical protein
MTDEEIPENVDLRFLAKQQTRILGVLADMRRDMSELQVTVSTMRADQGRASETLEHHSELLETIRDTQQNQGARLNAIDGRLALIEKHTGMVKA